MKTLLLSPSSPVLQRPFTAPVRPWDAAGLQALLVGRLAGTQLIVASNRAPYSHESVDGQIERIEAVSGLVTAVEPLLRASGGTWVAHGSGAADRVLVDAHDGWQVPAAASGSGYRLRRLWLTPDEAGGYCDGFANSGLWPLCHLAAVRPRFDADEWAHYRRVNEKFADAVAGEARQRDPIVLVQDYHLALLPALLRRRLPQATIVSFWHIPWPHAEQMQICPWLPELVEGLLGSDIVGLQTPKDQRNFIAAAAGCGRVADGTHELVGRGRRTRVAAYPISIAWPLPSALPAPATRQDADATRLIVGIDRLDYTKGLLERLRAVEQLLLSRPQWLGRLRLIQVASPSRSALPSYAAFRAEVEAEAQRINQRFARPDWSPIELRLEQHGHAAVVKLYRAADLCLVTSLNDGMNLVSKEFVAAREDGQGVLVLSRFAGAALELTQALIVNPYDTHAVAAVLHQGLTMSAAEQRQRMQALRDTVQNRNVHRWAAHLLLDAAVMREAGSRQQRAGE